jgi:transposase InsO family protein
MGDSTAGKQYLIGFLDDRSRLIVYYEVLPDKTMHSTAQALRCALNENPKPYKLTSDNGTEFTGHDFQEVLQEAEIIHWRTIPYTPEQNGKIERFWGTIEGSLASYEELDEAVLNYNYNWPHSALTELTGCKTVPWDAWCNWERWEGHDDLDEIYE